MLMKVQTVAVQTVTTAADSAEKFAQCWTHGKKRNLNSLVENGLGGYVCKPGEECQVSAWDKGQERRNLCAVHGKVRSVDALTEDGSGGMVCKPDNKCMQIGDQPASRARWSGWAWRSREPTGPNLPRTRISEVVLVGQVLEWNGKFGWIQPEVPVEHELAHKHRGKIYVSSSDLTGAAELVVGIAVKFVLYSDSSGLGAQDVVFLSKGEDAETASSRA